MVQTLMSMVRNDQKWKVTKNGETKNLESLDILLKVDGKSTFVFVENHSHTRSNATSKQNPISQISA